MTSFESLLRAEMRSFVASNLRKAVGERRDSGDIIELRKAIWALDDFAVWAKEAGRRQGRELDSRFN